jgi:hypothetical protein
VFVDRVARAPAMQMPGAGHNRRFVGRKALPMSMKKSDLDKNLGLKIGGRMKATAIPARFGQAAAALPDRREQRRRDAAAGLVPFACKLPADLVRVLQERGAAHAGGVNGLVAELLATGLR